MEDLVIGDHLIFASEFRPEPSAGDAKAGVKKDHLRRSFILPKTGLGHQNLSAEIVCDVRQCHASVVGKFLQSHAIMCDELAHFTGT